MSFFPGNDELLARVGQASFLTLISLGLTFALLVVSESRIGHSLAHLATSPAVLLSRGLARLVTVIHDSELTTAPSRARVDVATGAHGLLAHAEPPGGGLAAESCGRE